MSLITSTTGSDWCLSTRAGTSIGSHTHNLQNPPFGSPQIPSAFIWDFATGAFNYNFTLDGNVVNVPFNGGIVNAVGGIYPAPWGGQIKLSSGLGFLATLLDLGASGNPSDFVVNYTNSFRNDGLKFTRTQLYNPTDPNANTILGPYALSYQTPGVKDFNIVLYHGNYASSGTPTGYNRGPNVFGYYPGNQGTYTNNNSGNGNCYDNASFRIYLVQKSVPVIQQNGPLGPIVADGTTITGMDTIINTNNITLFNGNSRKSPIDATMGSNPNTYWTIQLQDNISGSYNVATLGTHYQLTGTLGGSGTDGSNTILITWLVRGNFKVGCYVVDQVYNPANYGSGTVQYNSDGSYINFTVGVATINTIVLPIVSADIQPVTVYNNVIISNVDPITGVQPFQIQASLALDLSNSSYVQTVNTDPPVSFNLNLSDWQSELSTCCNISCRVLKAGTTQVIQQRNGLGPHTFALTDGDYAVGFTLSPKGSNAVTSISLNQQAGSL